MNIRNRITHDLAVLLVGLGILLPGCAGFGKLQQAITRNKNEDIGPPRVARTENLTQDFDRQRDTAQFEAAASCWERGDIEGSRKLLEQLLARNPNHRRARLLLADLYLFNGQAEKSAAELHQALLADPKDAMAHHSLAQVLEACGRRDEAMDHYKAATQYEPNNELYAQSYKMALDLSPTAAPRELVAATPRKPVDAVKPGSSGPVNGSDRQVQTVCAALPLGTELHSDRIEECPSFSVSARCFAGSNIDDWVKPVDFAMPDDQAGPATERQGSTMELLAAASGNSMRSQPAFYSVASSSSDAPAIRLASCDMPDLTAPRVAEPIVKLATRPAESAPADAADNNRQSRQSPLRESVVALAQGDTQGAIAAATRGLEQTPENSAALYRVLGAAHYRHGDYQLAQTELAQALSLDKSDALSYFLMSATLEKLDDHQSAVRYRSEAARLDVRYSQ